MRWWGWLLVSPVILFVVFVAFGFMFPGDPAKQRSRDAIDLCWDGYKKKSNSAGTAQFIAGACEKMEGDFVKKWGHRP